MTIMQKDAFPTPGHDHIGCVETALGRADTLCQSRGARLTELRRTVLAQVWSSHAPVGAYDILQALQERKPGTRIAPPTVYRALDFLIAHGLVHRIESLNAFAGCSQPEHDHSGGFLICGECGVTAEIDDANVSQALRASANRRGFAIERATLELLGRCPACQTPASETPSIETGKREVSS